MTRTLPATRTPPLEDESRFAFGANWRNFLRLIDDSRIEQATSDLGEMLSHVDLAGTRFLDVGSGSGLSSLAARRLGASVHSFDYDRESVECTRELRRRYDGESGDAWVAEEGSALDRAYLAGLGDFDVVYAWGVLHATGAMWDAMAAVADRVRPGGTLFIAMYNDQGFRSKVWRILKHAYVRVPALRPLLLSISMGAFWLPTILIDAARGRPPFWKSYGRSRGMSVWHDLVDWAGGYPFEVARPGDVHDFYRERGFTLVRLITRFSGCNEFVFVRDTEKRVAR